MNERIKELFKQTNLHRNDHTTEQRQAAVEKFAELIVKECADFLKNTLDDHFAAEQLAEHFGVE